MCSDQLMLDEELEVALQHEQMYYNTIIAFHGGYDKLNVSESSDGGM